MRIVARRAEGYAHDVEIEGGHEVRVDEPAAAGGSDSGPSPTRLLAAGLASCIAITVEMYAQRKGWDVGAIEVDVEMGYDGPVPSSFEVGLKLPADLDEEQRRRLLTIATKCPVHKVLAGEAHVNVTERLEPA
ncbi:MAG TPA: OsmC family protein [Solirubrobacterales bacterium]|nr:OsmC family protein [Solirubrobacterales bacterium]